MSSGIYNELLLNYSTTKDFRTVPMHLPAVDGPRRSALRRIDRTANFVMGTEAPSQGNSLDQRTFELTDNLTIPVRVALVHARHEGPVLQVDQPVRARTRLGNWTFTTWTTSTTASRRRYVDQRAGADRSVQRTGERSRRRRTASYARTLGRRRRRCRSTPACAWTSRSSQRPPLNQTVLTEYGRATSSVPDNGADLSALRHSTGT